MSAPGDPAFEDWKAEARARDILEEALAHGAVLKGGPVEKVGPCPACGGTDRFSVNLRKKIFHCRAAGVGGDVIAMVQYLDGVDFATACEMLTGRPAPRSDTRLTDIDRARIADEQAERARQAAAKDMERRRLEELFREDERRRAWNLWRKARPAAGTPVEAYLRHRGLVLPEGAKLRFAPEHEMYSESRKLLHRGPAMLAAITAADGRFLGLHATWIDLSQPKGKVKVIDPEKGEPVASKKVRGGQKGGRIVLVPHSRSLAGPARLIVGEGIETVIAVWLALREARSPLLDGAAFWSSVNLGNLAGPALETVRHPTKTITDRNGRVRATRVKGDVPDMDGVAMTVPDSVTELIMLGDGDSDPFTTRMAIRRAGKRFASPGRVIRAAFAHEGQDFNDMLRDAGGTEEGNAAPREEVTA